MYLVSSNFYTTVPGFLNNGVFQVTAGNATGVSSGYTGKYVNTGSFVVTGVASAVGFSMGYDEGGSLNNSGSIIVSAGVSGTSTAIAVGGLDSTGLSITNSGTITAQVAIHEQNSSSPAQTPILTLINSGTINGDIILNEGPSALFNGVGRVAGAQIHNTGLINGVLNLDINGNDLYDGAFGRQTGGIVLGNGVDTVFLGNDGETVHGGSGDSIIVGGSGADTVLGGAGNETIDGGAGDDILDGGAGVNTLSFASAAQGVTVNLAVEGASQATGVGSKTISNFQYLTGSSHDDVLIGDASDNLIDGDGGNDVLDGAGGVNTVSFSSAVVGVHVSLALSGVAQATGVGSVTLSHFANLTGSAHNDTLIGDANPNVIHGGDGNDLIVGGGGNDALDGGAGVNTVSFAFATQAVNVNLALQGAAQTTGIGSVILTNFQNLIGSAFADVLTGDANNNFIDGGGGDDTLDGGPGFDTVSFGSAIEGVTVSLALQGAAQASGAGSVTLRNFEGLYGSAYDDVLTGNASANVIHGGAGNDQIDGGGGDDTLDGGSGVNTVSFASATQGVTVSLALPGSVQATGVGSVTLTNFQNLTGSSHDDVLIGDANANVILGGAGDDVIDGGGGADTLDGGVGTNTVTFYSAGQGVAVSLALQGAVQTTGVGAVMLTNFQNLTGSNYDDVLTGDGNANVISGGAGGDVIDGKGGDDTLDGGAGVNTVSFASATHGVTVSLALQGLVQSTGVGAVTLTNFQNLNGSAFDDVLTGDANANVISGGGGNDTLDGGGGNDTLDGGSGFNTAIFHVASTSVTLIHNLDGSLTVNAGGYGLDTLWNIQVLQFNDGSFSATSGLASDFLTMGHSSVILRGANGDVSFGAVNGGSGGVTTQDIGVVPMDWTIQQSGDFNGDGKADLLWRNAGGDTAVWLANGGAGYTGFTPHEIGVIPKDWTIQQVGDFNGDGRADILWRNAGGDTAIWLANAGAGYAGFTPQEIGVVPTGWSIQQVGDFNGDGKADILWRNTLGDTAVWLSNAGAGYTGFTPNELGVVPTDWTVVQVGDFNGDGKADILWREAAGDTAIWLSKAGAGYAGVTPTDLGVVPTGWTVQQVGDFNGDGRADILWRTTSGDLDLWRSSGNPTSVSFTSQGLGASPIGSAAHPDSDLNGDGRADLIWRHASGEVALWTSNGDSSFTPHDLGLVPANWIIQQTGDFNGDGVADILWRNASGRASIWVTNGDLSVTPHDLGVTPTDWTVQPLGDFNGDGKADILWRNTAGDTAVWLSNPGAGYTGFTPKDLGVVPAGWTIQQLGDFNGDGKADILWRNAGGDTAVWLSTPGAGYSGLAPKDLGAVPTNWTIQQVGDFNGDGKADILWRDSAGHVALWQSNPGAGFAGFTSHDEGVMSTAWTAQHGGDLNGDGLADIVWRNASSGDVTVWLSNNAPGQAGFTIHDLGTVPTDWHLL